MRPAGQMVQTARVSYSFLISRHSEPFGWPGTGNHRVRTTAVELQTEQNTAWGRTDGTDRDIPQDLNIHVQ